MGTLHKGQHRILNITHSFPCRMRNVSVKIWAQNQNTHFMFSNFFFKNRAVYVIMCKNIAEPGRQQMTIWHVCNTCWIPKAKNRSQNMEYLLFFYCNSGCKNTLQCYIVCTLPVLFVPWKQPLPLSSFASSWTKSLLYEELLIFITNYRKTALL